ncbi:patatin-like phospholipase family protein [Vagococcus silagei]|uniref:Patatin-like phospholipase family protein n=2 Tax=Vagococcus silagei TaxID=2508885 RepID=A0A4S3B1R4_9ENTE|nr:patatin-like phospholipase family protein [Vagococcus silagei]
MNKTEINFEVRGMLKKITVTQLKRKEIELDQFTMWLPFHLSVTEAWKNFVTRSLKYEDDHITYGLWDEKQLVAVIEGVMIAETFELLNFFTKPKKFSWRKFFDETGILARQYRCKKIKLSLPKPLLLDTSLLLKEGFNEVEHVENVTFEKELSYHTGLVFGGGGAKGSYQIGSWKALIESDISIEKVSGTSVGALNGGFVVQGDYEIAEKMWQTITTKDILKFPDEQPFETFRMDELWKNVHDLAVLAVKSKGIDTTPLQKMIHQKLDAERLLSSPIDFNIIATKANTMSETVMNKKNLTVESLPLWLQASASFYPAMAFCEIDKENYIDGGYRNNTPQDTLFNQGLTDLFVIDVSGPGMTKRSTPPNDLSIVYQKSLWSLGSVLLFEPKRAKWNMKLGYLETKKELHQLSGRYYSFEKTGFKKEIAQLSLGFIDELLRNLKDIELDADTFQNIIQDDLEKRGMSLETASLFLLESLARHCKIEPTQVYTVKSLSQLISAHFGDVNEFQPQHLLSVGEWMDHYLEDASLKASQMDIWSFYLYFKEYGFTQPKEVKNRMIFSLRVSMEALFLIYIERGQKEDGK